MLESEISMGGTGSGSGVMVKPPNDGGKEGDGVKRGWDWRKDLVDRDVSGGALLRMLRLGLARQISRAWVEGF